MEYLLVNEYSRFQEQIKKNLKQVSETFIPYETKIAELLVYHLWTDICNVSHASDFQDPKISKSEKSIQSRSYSNYSTCSYVSLCKKKWPLIHSYIVNYNAGIKSSYDEHSTNVYMQLVLGVQFKRLIINILAYQKHFCLVIGLLEEEFVFLFF